MNVEPRGVCVCEMVRCDQSMRTGNSTTNPKLGNKPKTRQQTQNSGKNCGVSVEHRGVCVCGMLGCNQSMKTQNSTTNLPGLL